jgi:hypothetical protein
VSPLLWSGGFMCPHTANEFNCYNKKALSMGLPLLQECPFKEYLSDVEYF